MSTLTAAELTVLARHLHPDTLRSLTTDYAATVRREVHSWHGSAVDGWRHRSERAGILWTDPDGRKGLITWKAARAAAAAALELAGPAYRQRPPKQLARQAARVPKPAPVPITDGQLDLFETLAGVS